METKPIQILGVLGSLRKGSYNGMALHAAKGLVPEGAVLEEFTLDGIPPYNQDDEMEPPAKVVEFKAKIRAADAILFATPEYNYSISGVLKNAIDWASRPYGDNAWDGKLAVMIGATIGILGTARAQYHMRQVFLNLNVHTLNSPEVFIANASEKFDSNGNLTDQKAREMIRRLLVALVEAVRRERAHSAIAVS